MTEHRLGQLTLTIQNFLTTRDVCFEVATVYNLQCDHLNHSMYQPPYEMFTQLH